MRNYLITKEMAEEYGVPVNKLERVFNYHSFEEVRSYLEDLGIEDVSESKLEDFMMTLNKHDDDALQGMISFLQYMGKL